MDNCDYCGRLVTAKGDKDYPREHYPRGVKDVGEDNETICLRCLSNLVGKVIMDKVTGRTTA